MTVGFVLHGDGSCSSWAEHAGGGDIVQIVGPRRGVKLDPDVRHIQIGGDETAPPSIGSILEALPACITVQTFVEVPDERESNPCDQKPTCCSPGGGAARRCHNGTSGCNDRRDFPDDASEVWFAAESTAVRVVQRHFQVTRGLDRRRITSSGYWKKGEIAFRDARRDR